MADKDDLVGRRIGEFVVLEPIGEGGFGEVYRCEQPLLAREAVVKVLHSRLRRRDVIAQRFLREAQLASRLAHPYAAHIYAFGIEDDGLLWIAMERVQGITLADWLKMHGPMPLGQFVSLFERIASVVQAAHECGIVHRDLKPSNMMVIDRAGQLLPKLLDFGVAKLLEGAVLPEGLLDIHYPPLPAIVDPEDQALVLAARASGPATLTQPPLPGDQDRLTPSNQAIGSPAYMSPELWHNAGTVGPASDLYALAVVAYEALTGRRPFNAETLADFAELHCHGKVPPLGDGFPPALDRMFQRALSKRPEDRWATGVELAGELRLASGIGAGQADLPRIDDDVRDAWLSDAPQPLAESVSALDGARTVHQARDAAQVLVRNLLRYLLAVVLATRTGDAQDDPALLELVRALRKRELTAEERLQLLRLLVRPHAAHPVPELIDLVTPGASGTDALEPILGFYSIAEDSGSEDAVLLRLGRRIPELTQLLRKTAFALDYVLVVPRGGAPERWTGRRQPHRLHAAVMGGELVDGHPMLLDRNGHVCADLWPLVQAAAPSDGAEPELFVFDGRGRHGPQMIAAARGSGDSNAWSWVETHLIAKVEAKARMSDHVRTAARQWDDRGRPDALLWRGDVLADYEQWTRHTAAPPLGDHEAAFIAASRRTSRRARWIRRALVATAVLAVGVVVVGRAELQTRTAEQIAVQAEVEQGRQSLLHDDISEALLHLSEAYRRGDHSPGVSFMLARALQPRMAEQARFAAAKGHMWSAAFSPDGRQIVTTDDTCAQVWDAQTSRLLATLPHGAAVYQAVYSVDGTRLVTVSADVVRIWDPASGALMRELKQVRSDGKPRDYYLVALAPNGKLVAAIDAAGEAVHIWDASTGAALTELYNNAEGFPSVAFSNDGRWLATSGGDDVRVFDTSTWTRALTIAGPHIHSLSFDPTGPQLATGSSTGDASIWLVPSGARVRHLREIGEPVDKVAFSPNGELVVTASRDGAEQVWSTKSGRLQSQGNYVRSRILSVEFDPASKLVVAAGERGKVVVADAALGVTVAMFEATQSVVRVVHFDPSSHRVVGASRTGSAWVWDATSPYRRWSSQPVGDDCGLVMSRKSDQRVVAIGCGDHNTLVWDTSRDQLIAELPSVIPVDGDFTAASPAVAVDGSRAAIARGHMVAIYELPGGRLLRTITHGAVVSAVAFASAGHDVVSGTVGGAVLVTREGRDPIVVGTSSFGIDAAELLADGRVVAVDAAKQMQIYGADLEHSRLLAKLEVPTRVGLLRPSQDGHRLITVPSYTGDTASAVLWDLEHFSIISKLEGNVGQVLSARFTGSDRAILTTGNDGAVRLWDGTTGQPVQTYRANARFFNDATLAPDGSMVVAGDSEGQLRFWDVATGRPLWALQAHKSHVVGLHFEGDDLVTRGFSGDVARWTLPKPELVITACRANRACGIVTR